MSKSSASVKRSRLPRLDAYHWLLLVAIVVYIVVFARLAFEIHAGMRTHKADLGQFDQAIWNSSQGRFLQQTDGGGISTRMTDHVEPILVFISPVYWLWSDVRAILLLQVVFVAAGAWLLYHLALRRFDRALSQTERTQIWKWEPLRQSARPIALALAIAFLLAPQLQSAVLTEFHAVPLSVPLILWALWAVEGQRWRHFAAAVVLVALVKEEMALVAFMLGLWGVWRGWRQGVESGDRPPVHTGMIWGSALAALSLAWFVLATFVIVPHFAAPFYGSEQSTYFARYGALGNSPLDIAKSFITQPGVVWSIATEPARLVYLWRLLAIFGLLALLAPEVLLLSLPVLLANLLSAYPAQFYGEFHYSAPVVPFFAAAAVFGVARLWGWLWRRTERSSASFQHLPAADTGTMALASFATNPASTLRPLLMLLAVLWLLAWAGWTYAQAGRAWLGGRSDPTPITDHHRLLDRFVRQVPAGAPLTATAAVHPHLSQRQHIYQFPDGFEVEVPATWALLDVTTNTDMAPGDLTTRVEEMLAGEWGIVDAADGFLLLARGAQEQTIPQAFYSFTQANESASTTLALDWVRWRQTKIEATFAEWDSSQGEPRLDIVGVNGDLLYTLDSAAPPALVWRPWQTWQPGESLRVTTLPLTLPRAFSVRQASIQEPTIFYRGADEVLRSIPEYEFTGSNPLAEGIAQLTGASPIGQQTTLQVEGETIALQGWVADRTYWPGDAVDLWLRLEGERVSEGWTIYVHLLRNGETIAQQDGAPRFFGPVDAPGSLAALGYVADWRAVTIPADALVQGEWRIEIGLYNADTGERAVAQGSSADHLTFGIDVTAPVPDQACALNPAACASQPTVYPR